MASLSCSKLENPNSGNEEIQKITNVKNKLGNWGVVFVPLSRAFYPRAWDRLYPTVTRNVLSCMEIYIFFYQKGILLDLIIVANKL